MGWLADQSNASLGSNPGDRVSFFLRQKMKRIHSEQKDCSSRNTIWPKKIITKIRIRTNFFNFFILGKSWFPPKKFCNIDYRSSFPLRLHEQASSDSSASSVICKSSDRLGELSACSQDCAWKWANLPLTSSSWLFFKSRSFFSCTF